LVKVTPLGAVMIPPLPSVVVIRPGTGTIPPASSVVVISSETVCIMVVEITRGAVMLLPSASVVVVVVLITLGMDCPVVVGIIMGTRIGSPSSLIDVVTRAAAVDVVIRSGVAVTT
jgi:hypothetical protein